MSIPTTLTLQRHFSALTKFARIESRFCGRKRRGKAALKVPINPYAGSVYSRSVAVGLICCDIGLASLWAIVAIPLSTILAHECLVGKRRVHSIILLPYDAAAVTALASRDFWAFNEGTCEAYFSALGVDQQYPPVIGAVAYPYNNSIAQCLETRYICSAQIPPPARKFLDG
jgi:hypothetical protein